MNAGQDAYRPNRFQASTIQNIRYRTFHELLLNIAEAVLERASERR